MPHHTTTTNWLPAAVLRPLQKMPEDIVHLSIGDFYLLVQVRDESDPLARGLAQADERGPLRQEDASLGELRTCFQPEPVGAQADRWVGARCEVESLAPLRSTPHYAAKIEKRADGASFLRKITVGRTRNHDIVLRDNSVSKFHASFELIDDDILELRDQGSKNQTIVNGRRVQGTTRVFPGDTIQFGAVKTTLCTTRGLWNSVRPPM
jgi:hypothetical protein